MTLHGSDRFRQFNVKTINIHDNYIPIISSNYYLDKRDGSILVS